LRRRSWNLTIIFSITLLILGNGFTTINQGKQTIHIDIKNKTALCYFSIDNPFDELSGLAASRINKDILWVHEDDWSPYIYAINTNGMIIGKYQIGIDGNDVEDIAIGYDSTQKISYLYIAHIGDNNANRSTIFIRKVPEPHIEKTSEYNEYNLSNYQTITLQYPDGPKDAESLMIDSNGDLYIITKRLSPNKIYYTPYPQSSSKIITLELVATLPKKPEFEWITAGDISSDGRLLILRNDRTKDYASIWYRSQSIETKDLFQKNHTLLDISDEPQGEAICFNSNSSGFYTIGEHAGYQEIPLWYYQLSINEIANEETDNVFYLLIIFFVLLIFIIICLYLFINNQFIKKGSIVIIIILLIGILSSILLQDPEAITIEQNTLSLEDSLDNILTINYQDSKFTYSLEQLLSNFSSVTGRGSMINQFGSITGPNLYVGIPINDIVRSVENLPENYCVHVSSNDYTYNFSKENINGLFPVYVEDTNSYINDSVTMVIAYQENGKILTKNNGGPFKIAYITDDGAITQSNLWIKSINKLEIKKLYNDTIDENEPPIINITSNNQTGFAPLSIQFHAETYDPDGIITFYQWDFGDGTQVKIKNVTHVYTKLGTFNATFTSKDNNGSIRQQTIIIKIDCKVKDGFISPTDYNDPENGWESPANAFDDKENTRAICTKKGLWKWQWTGFLELVSPLQIQCNKIRFKAWYDEKWCDSIDVDVYVNNTWIDIYEGTYNNRKWEILTFPIYTIAKARVRFHVRSSMMGIDADLYEFDFFTNTTNISPNTDFSYDSSQLLRKVSIYFTDLSTDPDGFIVHWDWDFGEGNTSDLQNPAHVFHALGTFNIRLTVTDNSGETNSMVKQITIENQKPIADFSYTPTIPTTEDMVDFNDISIDFDGKITSWNWDFGDGNGSTIQNPHHQYSRTGIYQVKLMVKDNDGSNSLKKRQIQITEPSDEEYILIMRYNGNQKTYTLDDLEHMDALNGVGGRLNSVGSIAGPFEYKGVPISVLSDEFSLISESYTMTVIADDGYSVTYTSDEIQGTVQVYDTEGNDQGIGGVTMMLAYEEEGIKDFPGGPLRVAFVDDEEQLTDSFLWSKHVVEIEFQDLSI